MKKRIISLLLIALMLVPAFTLPASASSTNEVQSKMDSYMDYIAAYARANGVTNVYWNAGIRDDNSTKTLKAAVDRGDYSVGLTFSKCAGTGGTHLHQKKVNGKSGCTSNIFSGAAQCHGFAKYFCYVLYNSVPDVLNKNASTSNWRCYKHVKGDSSSAYPGIQPGDFLRYWYFKSNGNKVIHSAIVYSVVDGKVTVIDCNQSSKECIIQKHESWFHKNGSSGTTAKESEFKAYYDAGRAYICRYKGVIPDVEVTDIEPIRGTPAPLTNLKVSSVNTKGVAPAHSGPAGKDPITTNYKLGDTLVAVNSVVNSSNNTWYELDTGEWIFSNYVSEASVYIPEPVTCAHNYNSVGICRKCGTAFPLVISSVSKTMKVSSVNSTGTAPSHSSPYGDASIGKRYKKGDTVSVTGQAKNAAGNLWYQLSDGSWLVSSYLTEVEAHTHSYDSVGKCTKCGAQFPLQITKVSKTMKVTSVNSTGTAPSHSAPYGDASIGKRYSKGDTVTVTGQAKNAVGNLWYQLSDGSWLVSDYLTEVAASGNTRTGVVHVPSGSNGLAINDKPASSPKNSTEIGVIPPGGKCTVYPDKTSGNWYWVEYNGVQGYAHSSYITLQ